MGYFAESDIRKDLENQRKHGISFRGAQEAFGDPNRLIFEEIDHSAPAETRYKCIGKVKGKACTVRFTYHEGKIRILGAGYWRKERKIDERQIENR